MELTKTALVLGVTLLALMGSMYYIKSQPDDSFIKPSDFSSLRTSDLRLRLSLFRQWMQKYNKNYGVGESAMRFATWSKMYDFVQEHNAKGLSWVTEVNQFADLTREEFASMYLGYKPNPNKVRRVTVLDDGDLPTAVDWRNKSAVVFVKNQGQCGSCWSFSTTAALEALKVIKGGTLTSLSEQQLIDCSSSYGNQGCNGGEMDDAFQYVRDKGIERASTYPYTGTNGTCKYSASKVVFQNKGYTDVTVNSPTQLQAAVAQQVVSIAIEADQSAFQSYSSGIISSDCGTNLDHGVSIVGYGTGYWIVRNSWGSSWGEKGYVRIATGTQNNGAGVCGINSDPSYPTA